MKKSQSIVEMESEEFGTVLKPSELKVKKRLAVMRKHERKIRKQELSLNEKADYEV